MPVATYQSPVCPEDCTTIDLPAVDFANCLEDFYEEASEIQGIYIVEDDAADAGNPKAFPTDWTAALDWTAVLSQTDPDKVRYLEGIGDLPEPDQQIRLISKRRKKGGPKSFLLNFDVDNLNDVNREFIRYLECGVSAHIWFETIGGALYGGAKGIHVEVTKANLPLARGENSFAIGLLAFEWEHKAHPPRIVNPMA